MRFVAFLIIAAWISQVRAADISVKVTGVDDGAALVLQVYDSANAFGDFRDPAVTMRALARPGGVYKLENIPAGDVAILVFVDENGNGLIDKNFIGIPKEPLGFSNAYRPKGPPSFPRASFAITRNESAEIDIGIYRLLGQRGRVGVGAGVITRSSPYVQSDTSVVQGIPAITYNGERLQWLGPNLQYGLLGTGSWRLAASASYRVGVYEETDSPVLAGLGDREGTLMAGLGFRIEAPGGLNVLLRYEQDVFDRIGGAAGTARLSKGFQSGSLRLAPQLQLNWLSADIADYDFGVASAAATPLRPAYRVGSVLSYEIGLGGFLELTENWRLILNVSTEFLPDEIADSPIVNEDNVIKGFAAFTYVF